MIRLVVFVVAVLFLFLGVGVENGSLGCRLFLLCVGIRNSLRLRWLTAAGVFYILRKIGVSHEHVMTQSMDWNPYKPFVWKNDANGNTEQSEVTFADGYENLKPGQKLMYTCAKLPLPEDFEFDSLPEDFDHFEPILAQAMHRMPLFETAGVHTFFNGPESFTPDDRYYLGEAPELRNYWVAAGYNSIGIVSSGGAGMALAAWIDNDSARFTIAKMGFDSFICLGGFQHDYSRSFAAMLGWFVFEAACDVGRILLAFSEVDDLRDLVAVSKTVQRDIRKNHKADCKNAKKEEE